MREVVTVPTRNIVIGQKVHLDMAARARELRSVMTEAEKVVWQRLRGNRLGGLHFRRQQVIGGYIVDFYCHAAGLALELDGPIHERQADYDAERDQVLAAHGVRALRIQNEAVFEDIDSVLEMIRQGCKSQA